MNLDKVMPYIGGAFTMLVSLLIAWSWLAPVRVPQPHVNRNRVMHVCDWDLDEVRGWMDIAPMCRFYLFESVDCSKTTPYGNLLRMGDPGEGLGGSTEWWSEGIELTGTLIILPPDAGPLVGAHELCHAAGYDHATIWPGIKARHHLMSTRTGWQTASTKGM